MYFDASDDDQTSPTKKGSSGLYSGSSDLGWLLGPYLYPSCDLVSSFDNVQRPASAPPASSYVEQQQGSFNSSASNTRLLAPSLQPISLPNLPAFATEATTSDHEYQREHIPRPPNAFMLYRSDFLKKGVIPSHVERRQQNLSRIAGECWNMLSDEERSQWHAKSAKIHEEHYARYPDYKFRPSPRGLARGSRKTKEKMRRLATEDIGGDRIRLLREKYTKLNGPALVPTRRRGKSRPQKTLYDEGMFAAAHGPLPPLIPATPSVTPSASPLGTKPSLPSHMGKTSQDSVEREPLTVWDQRPQPLDFSTPSCADGSETGLSDYMRDLDITPTAATFKRNPIPVDLNMSTWPSMAYVDNLSMYSYDNLLGTRQLQLPYHGMNYGDLSVSSSPTLAFPCDGLDEIQSIYPLLPPADCAPYMFLSS